MKIRLVSALKLFAILFPVLVAAKYAVSLTGLADWSFTTILWQSVLFSVVFALLFTAYRKPKT